MKVSQEPQLDLKTVLELTTADHLFDVPIPPIDTADAVLKMTPSWRSNLGCVAGGSSSILNLNLITSNDF